jgi:hypothetical protein
VKSYAGLGSRLGLGQNLIRVVRPRFLELRQPGAKHLDSTLELPTMSRIKVIFAEFFLKIPK